MSIYIEEAGNEDWNDLPPMAGIRIRHEIVDEDVMIMRIEYAEQTFRGDRRTLTRIMPLGEPDEETHEKCMDWAAKTAGERNLVSQH